MPWLPCLDVTLCRDTYNPTENFSQSPIHTHASQNHITLSRTVKLYSDAVRVLFFLGSHSSKYEDDSRLRYGTRVVSFK
jgi:hypothetical protein